MSGRLTDGFREIIELRWSEFVELEHSDDVTNFDTIITSLARAAKKSNLRAIQVALDRLDGKIAAEIEVEYPKFYTLYPRATKKVDDPGIIDILHDVKGGTVIVESTPVGQNSFSDLVGSPADIDEQASTEEELPTGSLRAVLDKMLDSPKSVVAKILLAAEQVDNGDISYGDPKVKSVIVAGLMNLVHNNRTGAVFEVFDQIDGKVADKVKVLGDVFMVNYSEIAPANAVKNEDGVYQTEADNTTSSWVARLEEKHGKKRY